MAASTYYSLGQSFVVGKGRKKTPRKCAKESSESLLEILIFLFERVKSIAATSGTDSLTQGGRGEKGEGTSRKKA